MTIQEANRYITKQLTRVYDEAEASNISDWVVESLVGVKRTDRIANKSRTITPEQTEKIEYSIKRLLLHEQVQYVLNEAWFCGLKFYVDNNVLIPRPETEELVEWIISDCKFPVGSLSILDIGSGSGCIPIALKRRLGKAQVWSCDISPGALKVANRNATNLGIDVRFIELDFLEKKNWDNLPSFDIIVSNPPYIPETDKKDMQMNVLNYEPGLALFVPDNDPMTFYQAIAGFGKKDLTAEGSVYAEINESFAGSTSSIFQQNAYETVLTKDMQGKIRMLKAF